MFRKHEAGNKRIVERQGCSVIADHRKHELLHPCSTLDLSARHGARYGGGMTGERERMTMMPVLFSVPKLGVFVFPMAVLVLGLFWFLSHEILVQLPQFDLQFFERLPIGLLFWVSLQVASPSVSVLHDDVFCGMHHESIAGHFRCASEGRKWIR